MGLRAKSVNRYIKPFLHLALALPLIWLIWQWVAAFYQQPNGLGVNPPEYSNRFTGIWALRLLWLSLTVTPMARLTHQPWLILLRRMIGLWCFAYVVAHITSYVWLDYWFYWPDIWDDLNKRLYILFGFGAFVGLIPLAVTSTNFAMRKLGRKWKRLHRSVYIIAALAALHFLWMVKGFQYEPWIYAGILTVLLGYRVLMKWQADARAAKRRRNKIAKVGTLPS